ncbi:MAG: hypothetical protein R2707_15065 [Acidimicrobiales bacterium]
MVEDFPTKKKRRPRAELKELMIQGGVEVLQEFGVETQLSSVSYAKVFEHVERTHGVRITYGSVHERIWNSLQEYQLSVIERAGVWDQDGASADGGDYDWADWLQTMVALSSASDESVAEAATNGARATYATRTATSSAPADELMPADDDVDDVAEILAVAVADGLQLRSFLTGDDTTHLIPLAQAIVHEWARHRGGRASTQV